MLDGKKKLRLAITFTIVVLGTAVTLGAVYYDEIKNFVGPFESAKPTKDEDRGPVITANLTKNPVPLPKVPATSKKKAKTKKTAAAKKPADPIVEPVEPVTTPTAKKPADPIVEPDEPVTTPTAKKPADPIVEPDPPPENRCAELPFSYEFKIGDRDANHPFYGRYWGPNFGCTLAGAYDLGMPGPIQQVRARLNKMSEKQFERYKVRLEKIMRRYVCRTFDYYLSTCKEMLDPTHEKYLTKEQVRVLLQRSASLYDVGATDRFRSRRRRSARPKQTKVTEPPASSAEPPATFNPPANTSSTIGSKVGLKTRRHRSSRLCGNDLRACPKP